MYRLRERLVCFGHLVFGHVRIDLRHKRVVFMLCQLWGGASDAYCSMPRLQRVQVIVYWRGACNSAGLQCTRVPVSSTWCDPNG